ncbi:MAG: glycerol-3-phosphate acyltransferase [Dehalococcoidia bacterium]|jgi:glycerol-3-phosphate acyltransferase PlsY
MAWLVIIIGYLIGALPTAYLAGRLLKGEDIRRMGDENMGAGNAYHELGARVGITVGIIDAGKGALAVYIAQASNQSLAVVLITGTAAVVGHNWPVFLGFRGGRGESTTIGVLTMLIPQPMFIMAAPTILVLLITKKVPVASTVLFVPLSLLSWWFGARTPVILYSIALPCLVGFTHLLRTRLKVVSEA